MDTWEASLFTSGHKFDPSQQPACDWTLDTVDVGVPVQTITLIPDGSMFQRLCWSMTEEAYGWTEDKAEAVWS